jgi:polyhydroxyalkanoate synthesis regulator phasin
MLETIKKGLLASIGAAVLTRDRIRQTLDKLVQEGKLSSEEAERMADRMLEEGEKELKSLQEKILSSISKALKNLDLVPRKEFEDLKQRVEALEKGKKAGKTSGRKTGKR